MNRRFARSASEPGPAPRRGTKPALLCLRKIALKFRHVVDQVQAVGNHAASDMLSGVCADFSGLFIGEITFCAFAGGIRQPQKPQNASRCWQHGSSSLMTFLSLINSSWPVQSGVLGFDSALKLVDGAEQIDKWQKNEVLGFLIAPS